MAGRNIDLEMMKEIFSDKKTHIAVAKIKQLSIATDRSFLKCLVSVFPENREVIVRMSWSSTGPESGIVEFPSVDDLVLVGFPGGDNDMGHVISRLTSKEDKIPLKAIDGHMVIKSKTGKHLFLTTGDKIYLSKGDSTPAENLVLGQVLKTLLSDVLGKLKELSDTIATHTHAGNLGYPTSAPNEAGDFTALGGEFDGFKSSPVDDSAILSDIAFTEKGS